MERNVNLSYHVVAANNPKIHLRYATASEIEKMPNENTLLPDGSRVLLRAGAFSLPLHPGDEIEE